MNSKEKLKELYGGKPVVIILVVKGLIGQKDDEILQEIKEHLNALQDYTFKEIVIAQATEKPQ